jgi:hypothetical protein
VPSGHGQLAASIADAFEKYFSHVERIGNFPGGKACSFAELEDVIPTLAADVVIFMPHLPNVLVEPAPRKLRLREGESGTLTLHPAPKLVQRIKQFHPETLLVPFKLADVDMSRVDIVRWMLELHSALAVYSRLGDSRQYYVIDALANEVAVTKAELPTALVETVSHFLQAKRRRSVWKGDYALEVPVLPAFVAFSRKMQPAFAQIIERNVASGRWPGNFSFRCTHGFLSARAQRGFAITRRNVSKEGLTTKDFVWVSLELENEALVYYGEEGAKPSIDAPVHRLIYDKLPWVQSIVHGHVQVAGAVCYPIPLPRWPCGAENEGEDILAVAPTQDTELWVANVQGHGFVALLGGTDPRNALDELSKIKFSL